MKRILFSFIVVLLLAALSACTAGSEDHDSSAASLPVLHTFSENDFDRETDLQNQLNSEKQAEEDAVKKETSANSRFDAEKDAISSFSE